MNSRAARNDRCRQVGRIRYGPVIRSSTRRFMRHAWSSAANMTSVARMLFALSSTGAATASRRSPPNPTAVPPNDDRPAGGSGGAVVTITKLAVAPPNARSVTSADDRDDVGEYPFTTNGTYVVAMAR